MKLFIACLLGIGSMAHAFEVTGTSTTYDRAEVEARAQAQQRCGTIKPLQILMWIYTHSPDDTQQSATTQFACYDAQICHASYDFFTRTGEEVYKAQIAVNYSGEICAGDDSNQCGKML